MSDFYPHLSPSHWPLEGEGGTAVIRQFASIPVVEGS